MIQSEKIQGASYLLSRDGQIFAHRSMGRLRFDHDTAQLMPDSIRKIYSITKVFTAVAVMKLVEDGFLYLNQPVMTIIDEFNTPVHSKIKIIHLLTHTAGIAPCSGYFAEPYSVREEWWKADNWIKEAISGPASAPPGEAWIYSSVGYAILGEIISRVSGLHCEEYIRKNILEPLGMNDTCFDLPEEHLERTCFVWPWEREELQEEPEENQKWPPRSGGGLYSTLHDLWKFGQMTLNGGTFNGKRIISRKTLEDMTTNHLKPNTPAFHWGDNYQDFRYGLGFSLLLSDLLSPDTYNHEGYGRSTLYMDPTERLVAVYFIPADQDWVPEAIINPRAITWSGLL
jgi:CubicO group peptidase (beta-lactamase class C family)